MSVPEHKDYIVSSEAARRIAEAAGRRCLVVVGIHVKNASKRDIHWLLENSDKCINMLLERLINRVFSYIYREIALPIDVDSETTRERQGRVMKAGEAWEKYVYDYLTTTLKDTPITVQFGDTIPKDSRLWYRLSVPLKSSDQDAEWGDIDLVATLEDLPIAIISCKLSLHGRFTETLFYSLLFRTISHTKIVLVTPDVGRGQEKWVSEWGTPDKPSKDRLLAENYLDGVYVKNLPEFCKGIQTGDSTALGGNIRTLEDLPKDLIRWSEDITRLL